MKYPMTVHGAERLKAELHRLKTVERPAVIQAIADARSHGDLSENADYDAAKERQGFIEGRIADVESRLAHAQVINPADIYDHEGRDRLRRDRRARGRRTSGDTVSYQIVGDDEADIKLGQDLGQLADRAGADRQVGGRHRRGAGARRRSRIRGAGRPLRLRG